MLNQMRYAGQVYPVHNDDVFTQIEECFLRACLIW